MVQPPGSLETGVPRLSDVALDYLARNIACIKSLSDVPDTLVLSLFQVQSQQANEMALTRLAGVGGGGIGEGEGMKVLEPGGGWSLARLRSVAPERRPCRPDPQPPKPTAQRVLQQGKLTPRVLDLFSQSEAVMEVVQAMHIQRWTPPLIHDSRTSQPWDKSHLW